MEEHHITTEHPEIFMVQWKKANDTNIHGYKYQKEKSHYNLTIYLCDTFQIRKDK